MPRREEVFAEVVIKHAQRRGRAVQAIGRAPGAGEAREALERAVRALPGVSGDPDTVPDIMTYVDTYVTRLSAGQDHTDKINVRTDRCWIDGQHTSHTWTFDGQNHDCPGQVQPL